MKKTIAFYIFFCFFVSLFLFPADKEYKGPFVKVLKGGNFANKNFNSVLFGSVSFYKKRKLIKSDEEIEIRISRENSRHIDTVRSNTGEYFLLQAVGGTFRIKDVFYKKKHYKIDKKFSVYKSDLSYLGNIKVTLLKSSLDSYGYKIFMDTNFKALRFRSNIKLTGLINGNSPEKFLKNTEGKILVPVYQPSFRGEYDDKYNAFKAVENGDPDSLKLFLKKYDNLNKIWENDRTLLMTALTNRRKNIAGFLVEQGADINVKTKSGWNALTFAIENECLDLAKTLVRKGADVKTELDDGWNVLFMCLRYCCDKELLNMLLDGRCEVNKAKNDGWTPLMMALVYSDEEISTILFENGAGYKVADNERWTPLMYALRYEKHKLAKAIIEKGDDINAANTNGWTPLLFAIRNNASECAKLLVEKGADLTKGNRNGNTPLHFALEYNFPLIAEKIIKAGKGLNAKTRYGWSPLMVALRYDQPAAASMLLKKQVSVKGVTKDGWTTLQLAVRYDQSKNALEIIKRKKLNLNSVTKAGWTPLLLALRYNQPEVAEKLIKSGADINICNKFGWTPLMISIEYDQPQLAELLIKKGAERDKKNSKGKTALDIARKKGYFNIFKLLGGEGFLDAENKEKKIAKLNLLKGVWKNIIPLENGSVVLKCDNCAQSSQMCSAEIEYERSKSETYDYIVNELKKKGFKYDKGIKASREGGSLKNENIWGLVNFTNNTTTMVTALTVIILSDYKTGTTKTRASFNRMKMPRKMNLNIPKFKK